MCRGGGRGANRGINVSYSAVKKYGSSFVRYSRANLAGASAGEPPNLTEFLEVHLASADAPKDLCPTPPGAFSWLFFTCPVQAFETLQTYLSLDFSSYFTSGLVHEVTSRSHWAPSLRARHHGGGSRAVGRTGGVNDQDENPSRF